ncbi:hydrogenase expression/formation protein HypE [Oceanimonas sp. CHS3-5]|uniref:hydrogenase expression/formation protein HypE n=1 Tax=Oceanimonas sp. CHS3-5 TaxID=3068186 RepID=UPI00273EB28A|nr:hydrogenase expression/formation protein HypE [Oceanimonas sp. CHS3-5]MDP5291390.1 hydrogenase expression/formation protein HypE [Oceanimonas sp. CHS3-5]
MSNEHATITLAHGAGGGAMHQLIDSLFLTAFGDTPLLQKEDQARLPLAGLLAQGDRLALTTDSFVVSPLEFPGGDIGKLAVCGTINDLAVGGAMPLYLSAAFIIEEGLPLTLLARLVGSMAAAARQAGVTIVTGDTKVVERGMADKLFINTTGVGVIPAELNLSIGAARPGDRVLINGHVGDHGAAVMLAREELGLVGELASDCAALHTLIQPVLAQCAGVRCLRDATRGGLGGVLNEMAEASSVEIRLTEQELPLRPQTQALCELLGLEPLLLANEGLAAMVIAPEQAEQALALWRAHPLGRHARIIGEVLASASPGRLSLLGPYGGARLLEVPHGLQLPRIC